jgi:hypothetical protein
MKQRATKYCRWEIMFVDASLSATPLIPLPFTSNGCRAHRFAPTTVQTVSACRVSGCFVVSYEAAGFRFFLMGWTQKISCAKQEDASPNIASVARCERREHWETKARERLVCLHEYSEEGEPPVAPVSLSLSTPLFDYSGMKASAVWRLKILIQERNVHLHTWVNVHIERWLWTTQILGSWVRIQLRAEACVVRDVAMDERPIKILLNVKQIIVLHHKLCRIMINCVFLNIQVIVSKKS